MRRYLNESVTVHFHSIRSQLKLRFNHSTNCWQIWSFFAGARNPQWRWISICPQLAKVYARRGVIVSIEETVA